jgi:hypothetical protein
MARHVAVPPRGRNGSVVPRAVTRREHYRALSPQSSYTAAMHSEDGSVVSGSSRRSSLLSDRSSDDSFVTANPKGFLDHRSKRVPKLPIHRSIRERQADTDEEERQVYGSIPLQRSANLDLGRRAPVQSPARPSRVPPERRVGYERVVRPKSPAILAYESDERPRMHRHRGDERRHSRHHDERQYEADEDVAPDSSRTAEYHPKRSSKSGKLVMVRKKGETNVSRRTTREERHSAVARGERPSIVRAVPLKPEVETNLNTLLNPFKRSVKFT